MGAILHVPGMENACPEIVLASAARTVNTTTGILDMGCCTGLLIYLNISSASGTGGLQLNYLPVDPSDGVTQVTAFSMGAVKLTAGLVVIQLARGARDNISHSVHPSLPIVVSRLFRLQIIHADASSYTYQVSMVRLP